MALSTVVKISSITNLSDARYCAGMGVDFMGFCVDSKHPSYVTPLEFKEITGWVAGVKTVAEIENCPQEEVLGHLGDYQFNYLEVKNEKMLEHLMEIDKPFIYKVDLSELRNVPTHPRIHFYLVEAGKDPLSKSNLQLLKDFTENHSVILSCGEDKSYIKELLSKTKIKGIELQGGEEISPGLKDFDNLSEILEMLEID